MPQAALESSRVVMKAPLSDTVSRGKQEWCWHVK